MASRIMIMAGGTGGHVFPALAVARKLQQQGHDVVWLGTRKGLEAEIIPNAGIAIEWISIAGLRGKGWQSWLLAPFRLARAIWQSWFALRRSKPALVLGMGGFVTGPGGFVAWLQRIPLLIHEQNAIAGLTNRLLALFAKRILQAFPETFHGKKVIETGNPVRQEIASLQTPDSRFKDRDGPIRLLVLGGSLGARVLNQTAPAAVALMDIKDRPQIRHQAGKKLIDEAKKDYDQAGVQADVTPFIKDMDQALAWADIVLCRAGALTLSELTAAGVGAILVPFPFAVDDHQTANAKYLTQANAAILFPQHEMNAQSLNHKLTQLIKSRSQLLLMANAARSLAKPEATSTVTKLCLEHARG